ncbi:MAG: winged helix-turn-helix domain-containing protein [Actinobacteria bacterium]|nr:winged helix-turn-helix domain-containing protein [Actinomycetota bacterium]
MPTRHRVAALLAGAWTRRLTLVVAGGGYGKTTALREVAAGGRSGWVGIRPVDGEIDLLAARIAAALGLDPAAGPAAPGVAIGAEDRRRFAEEQAAALCERLTGLREPVLLVLDDLERLGEDGAAAHLLRALVLQAPPRLHLVLSGRRLPDLGLGAMAGSGEVLEIAAPDLAFTEEEVAALLTERLGDADAATTARCRELTGGWAAALTLVVDRLDRTAEPERPELLRRLPELGSPLWREFVGDLFEREPPAARTALALATVAPRLDPGLAGAVGVAAPGATLAGLASRGLLVAAGTGEALAMSPALAAVVAELVTSAEVEPLRERAAAWLEAEGRLGEALECRRGGPPEATGALLERAGQALVERGYGRLVVEQLGAVGSAGSPARAALLGAALESTGEWDRAIEAFRRAQSLAPDDRLEPAAAWRFGALLYFRGESTEALAVLRAAHEDDGAGDADAALVAAWLGSTLWSRGEGEPAAALASEALDRATRSGVPGALAAAHVAAALAAASSGDREANDRHYRAALTAAREAGDSIQLARIRANLSSRALEEGDYGRAIEEADAALTAGAGHRFFAALALCNKAEAQLRIGELDDARAALAESVEIYESLGSLQACAPQALLGTLYRERGDLARARMSLEQAARSAERSGDAHTEVFARCGLARTVAGEDPALAREQVAAAIRTASSLERAVALCTSAWVELSAGDSEAAARLALEAEAEARRTGDRPALAEALGLRGLAAGGQGADHLAAAAALWEELGSQVAQERALLALARVRDDAEAAASLRERLAERGVAAELDRPRPASELPRIVTLGRFAVLRGGEPVPAGAWQSRKARDLLKLLAAQRGRPISREAAAEALWPGEAPGPLSNRLSVALSTVRRVLDPGRVQPADHYVGGDERSLVLRTDRVEVDVVAFLAAAEAAVADPIPARLRDAEHLYTGDFLEEHPYEDWAVDCRELARSAALELSRLLAAAAVRDGDDLLAGRHLQRVLERDPYDAEAWIALIAAQGRLRRYGEARRRHAIYARRMAELEITPVPLSKALDGAGS